jgi:Predicted HD superfamily hydrolase
MDRVNKIINHPLYKKELDKITELEKERIYCKHTLEHFLDVARLMYIFSLENNQKIEKDIIYGTALLHDIGRAKEYLEGIPHEVASIEIGNLILPDCSYKKEEIFLIKEAIKEHRGQAAIKKLSLDKSSIILQQLLKKADKLTRNCFACAAESSCKWDEQKKNKRISY